MQKETRPFLSAALLSQLTERGDLKSYPRGGIPIREGEDSDALYVLLAGQVKIFTRDERGRELIYNVLKAGEFFGEMFLDGGSRSASARAMTEVRCVVVGPDAFRDFMKAYPEFAESLVLTLIARVRHATRQIRDLALGGVYERTVKLLNELAVDDAGTRMLPAAVTQQEIADRVGATREMVNRILQGLVRGGFLSRAGGRRLVIAKDLPKQW